MPTPPIASPSIVNPQQFDAGEKLWLQTVAEPSALQHAFRSGPANELLLYAGFSIEQIAQLVSTVGATHINARFLVLAGSTSTPVFTLALYASNSLKTRLSAYYVGASGSSAGAEPGIQVPHALAKSWIDRWAGVKETSVTPALFATQYGPLRGYTFQIDDFLDTLFDLTTLDGSNVLRANFGLHESYGTDDTLQQTFGLILRTYTTAGTPTSTRPLYDMTMPCPPICEF
jgi:hypothetical protein